MKSKKTHAVRLVDIAEKAGVSRVAVGKVLLGSGSDRIKVSKDTAKRIREIAEDLGYKPNRAAQRLGGKPSRMIGVITYLHAPSTEMNRLMHLEREAHAEGYQLTIRVLHQPGDEQEMKACLQGFESQGVDGIISLTGESCACTEQALSQFRACLYNGCSEVLGSLPGLVNNVGSGTQLAIKHLFETGRRRIGLAFCGNNPYDQLRRTVCMEMVKQQPGAVLFEWTPADITGHRRKLKPEEADDAVRELVLKQSVDGILSVNDYWAGALLKALHRARVNVPEDVGVIGHCNLELGQFTEPSLTTVEEHNEKMAKTLIEMFIRQLASQDSLQQQVVQTLVKRGSTSVDLPPDRKHEMR